MQKAIREADAKIIFTFFLLVFQYIISEWMKKFTGKGFVWRTFAFFIEIPVVLRRMFSLMINCLSVAWTDTSHCPLSADTAYACKGH